MPLPVKHPLGMAENPLALLAVKSLPMAHIFIFEPVFNWTL